MSNLLDQLIPSNLVVLPISLQDQVIQQDMYMEAIEDETIALADKLYALSTRVDRLEYAMDSIVLCLHISFLFMIIYTFFRYCIAKPQRKAAIITEPPMLITESPLQKV